jgi:hypothetical protein
MPLRLGSSEGLSRTRAVALAFDHEVSDDAVRVDLVLVGYLIAKRLVEPWCLEAEGFQVEAAAAVLSGPSLERANETGSSAPVTRLGLDPKLLEFTALAPPTTYCTADDLASFISREARQRPNLVQLRRCIVGLTEADVNDVRLGFRQIVVNADGQRHGGSCAA